MINYRIIKSRRKTIGLEIRNGEVIVRAPMFFSARQIDRFVTEHRDWIEKHLAKVKKQENEAQQLGALTEEKIRELSREAQKVIPERVRYYAPLIGVTYGRITIRCQKTRWGSCSSKGNLNFNCLLMMTPPEVLDSVVVHELCHRKHMNHSQQFYAEVLRVFPEYRKCHRWLKEHGAVLLKQAGR